MSSEESLVYSKLLSNSQKQTLLYINLAHVFFPYVVEKMVLVFASFIKEDMFSSKGIEKKYDLFINLKVWASLVAQWLRIRLPVQGTRVRALVLEDPTCCGATKRVRHNY